MSGRRLLVVALIAALLGACAGNDDASPATTTAPTSTTDGGGRIDQATASEQITFVFTAFFDGANPDTEAKLQLLEDPERVRAIYMASVNGDNEEKARRTSIRVTSVLLTSDFTADVIYDVLVDGADPPALADFLGSVVLLDGQWKITTAAFCDFAFLGQPQPEECG